jgi:hypothetical protein
MWSYNWNNLTEELTTMKITKTIKINSLNINKYFHVYLTEIINPGSDEKKRKEIKKK